VTPSGSAQGPWTVGDSPVGRSGLGSQPAQVAVMDGYSFRNPPGGKGKGEGGA
jgi:hypothetical protein